MIWVLIPVAAVGGGIAWLVNRKKKKKKKDAPPAKKPGRMPVTPKVTPKVPSKLPPKPTVDPVGPVVQPLPFKVVAPTETAPGGIAITSAFGAYKWATAKAVALGFTAADRADVVLSDIAQQALEAAGASFGVLNLGGVMISELPTPNDEEWSDLLTAAQGKSWGDVLTASEQWMQSKGLA